MSRFDIHTHSMYSNLRLLDCINQPRDLVDRAIEIGLAGICITDHESLSSFVEIDRIQEELIEKGSSFKIGRGDEIYLVDTRDKNQKYWHFILVAKDAIGCKALRELSSIAWINSYFDRGLERVPTLKSDLEKIVNKYGKGHLIFSTACLGSELDGLILEMDKAEREGRTEDRKNYNRKIVKFIKWCESLAGDDFYLEVQPARSEEQLIVNKKMGQIAKAMNKKIIVTTDAHYLKKEDRLVHKAFLNSKQGDREVDAFYEYAYLQTTEEVIKNLEGTGLDYYELEKNTLEIYDKIENYTIRRKQHVPEVKVYDYPKEAENSHKYDVSKYPTLDYLSHSDNIQERYWINQCQEALDKKELNTEEYLERLEEEADTKKVIGEKLETCMFAYPIFLQHYIDLFWECGSCVGAGRGSAGAGLNHYLLGISQTNPLKTNAPWFRYMNKERIEIGDIDTDLDPTKRELIFEKIREERGQLGCVQVCTFGTASAKSALQIAARGLGIDNDISQYLSSLIPSERGFLWPLKDAVCGNEEKDRKPNTKFINEIKQYDGLLDVAMSIEGLVVSRSIHASGVVFYDEDPYETACFMKAGNGSIVTQYSLHDAEACGDVKQDFLVTQQMTIMGQCIQLLQEHGYIEKELTLRQAYDKYVHPDKIPLEDDKLWDAIDSTDILALFQLNSAVGGNVVKQLVPRNVEELVSCNALMRLTGEKGAERPADRYERLKKHPEQWQQELDAWGFPQEQQEVLRKYMGADYGAPSSQEVLMLILMDKDTCHFTLAESNAARKVIAKKQMNKIPALKEKIVSQAVTPKLGEYIWEYVIMPQASYSFSRIHGFSYSLIACQAAYLATYFPSVYWNTAYLRAVSGLDENENTDYKKTAEGICDIISHGINVSLVDINKSEYFFEPDEENNRIIYGMKALNGVNGEVIQNIIANRPYKSLDDFVDRVKCNKTVVVSLIKAGAFDCFGERKDIMKQYIESVSDVKKRITLQNFDAVSRAGLLPASLNFQQRLFKFNKAFKKNCKKGDYLLLDKPNYYRFYSKFFDVDALEVVDNTVGITQKQWKKMYDKGMLPAKEYFQENQKELLDKLNNSIIQEQWDKYAAGSYSSWEMESLGMYYHDHELANVRNELYGFSDFESLPVNPVKERSFKKNGKEIPLYHIDRIIGTVIAKDDAHSSISVLTPKNTVITAKMTRDYFATYNRRISEIQLDGTKKNIEPGWFQKGTLVALGGIRRGDTFFLKKYSKTKFHQLYKITQVNKDGTIDMTHCRYGDEPEN